MAGLEQNQAAQLFLGYLEITHQLDIVDRVALAFGHVDGDIHFRLVRRYRYLGGLDPEIHIATILIVGHQFFEVTGQLFT